MAGHLTESLVDADPYACRPEPIAIVGVACHLPGGITSEDDLWRLLQEARSGQSDVPPSRFNVDAFYNPQSSLPDTMPMRGGYFLDEDLELFENSFFGINNLEASNMDPQQRKLLEVCFECLESAGLGLHNVAGKRVGCYVGNFTNDFTNMNLKDAAYSHRFASLGQGATLLSNRISYVFDLKGPSLTLDTACSSSLYSLHLAVQALRNRECDAAFVAGANIIQSPEQHMGTARLGVLSSSSTCHTFSADADGYGRAEGVGALYVKRLSDAIRDGDPIRSLIRGTAVNSNGKGNGITVPSTSGQLDVIERAYADAAIGRQSTAYVECHGTGTLVGDPIEIAAVSEFFRNPHDAQKPDSPIYVGSVKSNLGHSEAASAITSIIKASLILERRWIPATIGATKLNPAIPWQKNCARVVTSGMPWPTSVDNDDCRRINSFGYGGANAHCVLEAYDPTDPADSGRPDDEHDDPIMLYPLSAATEYSLHKNAQGIAGLNVDMMKLTDLAHTLIERRSQLPYRGFIIGRREDWSPSAQLESFKPTMTRPSSTTGVPSAFIFTGQGAQWPSMGKSLYERFPIFRQRIRHLDEVLARLPCPPQTSLQSILLDSKHSQTIHLPSFSQPACTAVQVALVDLLREWGVLPQYVVGHSSGEIAAAYAAGYLSAADAIIIAYGRGTVVSTVSLPGSMLAVGIGKPEAEKEIHSLDLQDEVCVACVNSPENVTISGNSDAIEKLLDHFSCAGRFARKVKTGGKAYHSHHMRMVGEEYEAYLESTLSDQPTEHVQKRSAVMISSVHARVIEEGEATSPRYWRENMESPVLFEQAIETLIGMDSCRMVELGPHPALELVVKQTVSHVNAADKVPLYTSTLVRNKDGAHSLMTLAGHLWCHGLAIDLNVVNTLRSSTGGALDHGRQPRVICNLPRYQWCYGDPLWNESRPSKEYRFRKFGHDELLGILTPGMSGSTHVWRNKLNPDDIPWLKDHRLGDDIVFPGAAYIDMAIKAFQQINPVEDGKHHIEIRDLRIQRALVLGEGMSVELFTELKRKATTALEYSSTTWNFTISTFEDEQCIHRANGKVVVVSNKVESHSLESPVMIDGETQEARTWYRQFDNVGLKFGSTFQTLEVVHCPRMRNRYTAQAQLKGETVPLDPYQGRYSYRVHPTIIDSLFQVALIGTTQGNACDLQAYVPTAIDRVSFFSGFDHANVTSYRAHVQVRPAAAGLVVCNTQLFDGKGHVVLSMDNLSSTLYAGVIVPKPERHPMLRVEWVPDLGKLMPGECDDLTKILEEARNVSDELKKSSESALLLSFAAKARCSSSILIATELLDVDTTWKLLNGGTKHACFSTLSFTSPTSDSELRGSSYQEMTSTTGTSHDRNLETERFDIILTDSNMEGRLCHLLEQNLSDTGMIIHTGKISPDVKETSDVQSTTTGAKRNISILRRRAVSKPATNGTGPGPTYDDKIVVISNQSDDIFATHLETELAGQIGARPARYNLHNVHMIPSGCIAIVTVELHEPFLTTASPSQLKSVQALADRASHTIWLTGGGNLHSPSTPDSAAIFGLSRAIAIEQPAVRFQVLALETPVTNPAPATHLIANILLSNPKSEEQQDTEFLLHNSIPHISRFIPDACLNSLFATCSSSSSPSPSSSSSSPSSTPFPLLPLHPPSSSPTVSTLDISLPGSFDTLHFLRSPPLPSIPRDSVEVSLEAVALNAKDLYSLAGRVGTHERTFALEGAGVVVRVGSAVEDFKPGDRVVVAAPMPFATRVVVPGWACGRMEEGERFEEMAAVPIGYMTALHGLVDRGGLGEGERVLIHSATGGVGMAALRVAGEIGAEVYATVGTGEKRALLREEFGVKEGRIFSSRDPEGFRDGVLSATDGEGVDVVLNSLTGEGLRAGIEACAAFGRFVEIGKRDMLDAGTLELGAFAKGLTFSAFDLSEYFHAKSGVGKRTWRSLLKRALEAHRKKPLPKPRVFGAAHVKEAFRAFAKGSRVGKICVSFEDPEALVPVKLPRRSYRFDPEKSYLLVGCLGGLGRSLSRYMLENGARRFVFIGRSGADKPAAKSLVEDLQNHGAWVHVVRGDVQNYEVVLEAVNAAPSPLGGVVQAAMGLGEALFREMTHEKWHSSLGPKVRGSWNLHRAIEGKDSQLDFFLLTSSVAGSVGTATESNYCAANSFLDRFAKHRRSLGKPATAVGFGTISEIGYLHEHPDIQRMLERRGMSSTTEAEFLDICDIALRSSAGDLDPRSAHILTGLEMAGKGSQDAMADPRMSILMHGGKSGGIDGGDGQRSSAGGVDALPESINSAVETKNRKEIVRAVFGSLAAKMSQLVLMPVDEITSDMTLSSVGMDSMLASEYRSFIFRTLKTDVPFLTLMAPGARMGDVAGFIAGKLME